MSCLLANAVALSTAATRAVAFGGPIPGISQSRRQASCYRAVALSGAYFEPDTKV